MNFEIMRHKIKNIKVEGDKMVVFYLFENGEMISNWFPFPTEFNIIQKWGMNKATWFDERVSKLVILNEELNRFKEKQLEEERNNI